MAYESTEQATKHYIYEKDSFVPMLQAVYQSPIELHQTPDWSNKPYSVHRDPLWKTVKKSKGFDDVWFYHCDHLGTPQEMTDHSGSIIWKAEYKAWGECKPEKAKSSFFENSEIISNNIRFQGQYFDEETGLHYNRHRYYSPYVGRFVSKDPIGFLGGYNHFVYTPNPIKWVDSLGLAKKSICKASDVSWKGFSAGQLAEHYDKHGHEFGNITQNEYLKKAKDFAATDTATTIDTIVGGTFVVKADVLTDTIFVGNIKTREIRTLYKNDGRDNDAFEAAVALASLKCGLGKKK